MNKSQVSGQQIVTRDEQLNSACNNLEDSGNSMNAAPFGRAPTEKHTAARGGSMVAF